MRLNRHKKGNHEKMSCEYGSAKALFKTARMIDITRIRRKCNDDMLVEPIRAQLKSQTVGRRIKYATAGNPMKSSKKRQLCTYTRPKLIKYAESHFIIPQMSAGAAYIQERLHDIKHLTSTECGGLRQDIARFRHQN
jgi:hypothetical protein